MSISNFFKNYQHLKELKNRSRLSQELKFESYHEMIEDIREKLKIIKLKNVINSPTDLTAKSFKLSDDDIEEVIIKSCDVAVKRTHLSKPILFIYDPRLKIMNSDSNFFKTILADISSNYDLNGEEVKIKYSINDIEKSTLKISSKLAYQSSTRDLHELPRQFFVTKNYKVIDLKSRNIFELDDVQRYYDITSISNISHIDLKNFSTKSLDQIILFQQIISRVMKDWSDENQDVEHLLWQVMMSVIVNDNHGKFFVIKGPGGNGKSTFMKVLSLISGLDNVIHANIHQFGDHNSINKINMSTRLIIGDDASTSHKLSDTGLSNLKSIVTGDPISVNVKYSENIVIQTRAPFIQGTNTDVNVYENNSALKSRMVVVDWTTKDYRSMSKSELTFNLDDLLTNELFIDIWAMMCLDKIKTFDEFILPQSVIDSTNEMIELNDSVKMFLDDIYHTIDGFERITIKLLYKKFMKWSKENNPSAGIMKYKSFVSQLASKSQQYQFEVVTQRARFKKESQTAESMILNIELDETDSGQQSYIKLLNPITQHEIDEIQQLEDFSNVNDRQYQIMMILAYKYHNTAMIQAVEGII